MSRVLRAIGIGLLPGLLLVPAAAVRADDPPPALSIGAQTVKPDAPPQQVEVTADQSLEWYQDQHMYVARGHARAVRGDMVVDADLLSAHEREPPPAANGANGAPGAKPAKPPKPPKPAPGSPAAKSDNGASDLDRLIADGHVVITDPRERITGEHAVDDLDKHVSVVTGDDLLYETEKETVTAKDSLEYWEEKKIAVARGHAVAIGGDRHVEGDVLTAEFRDNPNGQQQLWKLTSDGHVVVITKTDVSRGDKAVYDVASDVAVITGNVRITRADGTQLAGDVGEVDFKTNRSRLMNEGHGRVRALFDVENDGQDGGQDAGRVRNREKAETGAKGKPVMKKFGKPAGKVIPFVPEDDRRFAASAREPLAAHEHGLVAEHLGKQYNRRPVVHDVSLSLQRGEVVGLHGPNGAGKTTCFYLVTGLVTADTGSIWLDGVDVTSFPMYRRARLGLGYLPQEASIFRGLSVEDNIRAVLEVVEPDYGTREMMLDELLAEFGITHLRRAPSIALSGGERRRLEIARSLASQPHFVLLDEPFAGIDPIALGDIRDLVVHLRDRGIGVLITDHNVRATLEIVDRAYIIHDGKVLMEGLPQEIVDHADVRRVYLGEEFKM